MAQDGKPQRDLSERAPPALPTGTSAASPPPAPDAKTEPKLPGLVKITSSDAASPARPAIAAPPAAPGARPPLPPTPKAFVLTERGVAEHARVVQENGERGIDIPVAAARPAPAATPPPPAPAPASAQPKAAAPELAAPEAEEPAAPRREARRRAAGTPPRGKIAANDDAPSIGGLIFALQQKPSKRPFIVAAAASGLWVALGGVLGWAMLLPEISSASSFTELLGRPALVTVAATVVLPIALFWFLAMLVWRAQELKLMSSAMTEVAVRLAEPDRTAEQSVASLGQAVRRQVAFMNEAVSRALGRASELEALVHNEVSVLERSYGENEQKIRSIIQELAGERSALVGTSERMADTLKTVGTEVPALIDKLSDQQLKLAKIIEGAGQNLIALDTQLAQAGGRFEATLSARTEQLQGVLEDYTRALDATLASRAEQLDSQLIERTQALDAAFTERLKLVDESILRSTMAIDGTVGEKARALTSAMESHVKVLSETLGRQATDLDETLLNGLGAVRRTSENITRQSVKAIEGLANQADLLKNVSENLLQQVGSVTSRFEGQGQSIMRAANALEAANFRIDTTLQRRHAELSETLNALSNKSDHLDKIMHGYSTSIEDSLTAAETRAKAVTQQLAHGAEQHTQAALAELERIRHQTDAQASRALEDMRSRFSNVSMQVEQHLGSLSSRFDEASEDLKQQAARAADHLRREQERLRAEAERLPNATRESADAMRHILQEQLRALEQLSSLSARESSRRDIAPPAPLPPNAPATLTGQFVAQSQRLQPQALPPAMPPGVDNNSRWSLGYLLERASVEEDPMGPHLNIEAIARALDTPTATAIWGRFRAGQRGIMVRSIYTAEGRTTFDEVTARFRTDGEFRSSVERFLNEFERLLHDTEQTDPSGRVLQNHLVSDSGRVYLFLAHASGRLS
ncbi:MAG: hypothetical protein AB7K67_01275 [Hyphomicrobiaceae bacterium]